QRENGAVGTNAQRESDDNEKRKSHRFAQSAKCKAKVVHESHSARSALTGSTRVARRAGNKQAMSATATNMSVTANIVRKSVAPMPTRRLCDRRVQAKTPSSPSTTPAPTTRMPGRTLC